MPKVDTYSAKGTKLGTTNLPKEFGEEVNLKLLAQAIRVYEEKGHTGLAKAKTRGEVNRTKKKWYRQKGTGGARHGARSAPIFVGGGVAHGPRPIRRELNLPKKMAKRALDSAFSAKVKSKEIILVSGLSKLAKTKEASGLVNKLAKLFPGTKRFTFVLSDEGKYAKVALRNLESVSLARFKDLNAWSVFFGGLLVLDKEIFGKKK